MRDSIDLARKVIIAEEHRQHEADLYITISQAGLVVTAIADSTRRRLTEKGDLATLKLIHDDYNRIMTDQGLGSAVGQL